MTLGLFVIIFFSEILKISFIGIIRNQRDRKKKTIQGVRKRVSSSISMIPSVIILVMLKDKDKNMAGKGQKCEYHGLGPDYSRRQTSAD